MQAWKRITRLPQENTRLVKLFVNFIPCCVFNYAMTHCMYAPIVLNLTNPTCMYVSDSHCPKALKKFFRLTTFIFHWCYVPVTATVQSKFASLVRLIFPTSLPHPERQPHTSHTCIVACAVKCVFRAKRPTMCILAQKNSR